MGRIVFVVWPEAGHALPAVSLARSLVRRGHEVSFLSWDDAVPLLRTQGMPVEDVFQFSGLGEARERFRAGGGWSERLLDQRADAVLRALRGLRPSLVVLDPLLWRLTLQVARQLPCVHLSVSLPDEFDADVYPWSSGRPPGGQGLLDRAARRLAWEDVRLRAWLKHRHSVKVATDALDLSDAPELMRRASWPREWCEPRGFHKPALGVPEFVLCPRAFEFPEKKPRPYRYYVEAGVDLERVEDTGGTGELLGERRPLVVISFGSRVDTYQGVGGLLKLAAHAARRLPHVAFVMAAGQGGLDGAGLPPNLQVRAFIPQLALLKRASVMLTHGGLGTVKECITLGVPMCVVPIKWDQPSVAARVAYHGLGVSLHGQRPTADSLAGALRTLLELPQYRLRVALMKQEFARVAAEQPGVDLIDALARGRGDARAAHTSSRVVNEGHA